MISGSSTGLMGLRMAGAKASTMARSEEPFFSELNEMYQKNSSSRLTQSLLKGGRISISFW